MSSVSKYVDAFFSFMTIVQVMPLLDVMLGEVVLLEGVLKLGPQALVRPCLELFPFVSTFHFNVFHTTTLLLLLYMMSTYFYLFYNPCCCHG